MKIADILKVLNIFFLESLLGKSKKKGIHTTVGMGRGIRERRAEVLRQEKGNFIIIGEDLQPYSDIRLRAPDALDVDVYSTAKAAQRGLKTARKHNPSAKFTVQRITDDFLGRYVSRRKK